VVFKTFARPLSAALSAVAVLLVRCGLFPSKSFMAPRVEGESGLRDSWSAWHDRLAVRTARSLSVGCQWQQLSTRSPNSSFE
jgi:hypothetical protein